MSRPVVLAFVFDDENREKLHFHGLSTRRVSQVLDTRHILVPNRKRRRGLMLMIGRDYGGTCIAIPIERTEDPALWRPVTAWPCKEHELARLTAALRRQR